MAGRVRQITEMYVEQHTALRGRHAAHEARHHEPDDRGRRRRGARATCRSYYTVFQQTDEVPLQPIVAGRYHDEFARAVDWRFTRRHMIVDLVGDLSKHLLFDLRR